MTCIDPKQSLGPMRLIAAAFCAILVLLLAGCGGGGGGGGGGAIVAAGTGTGSSTGSGSGTGSGSSGSSGSGGVAAAANVAPIIIDNGPSGASGAVNIPYVSVTVCPPSGGACQTIDHVIVDTASEGLRLMSSVLNSSGFPAVTDSSGNPFAECAQFASGFSWGSVRQASVTIAGETVASLPIQIIGDPAFPSVPASCSSAGAAQNTVAEFGGNGVLGVGVFKQDCGSVCVGAAIPGTYYSCPASGCTESVMTLAQQVSNPVPYFKVDNNGVVVQLPAIADGGAANVAGSLIFGIGTQSNNGLGSAKAYGVSADTGSFSIALNARLYANSFVDSGSNFYFFDISGLAQCTGQTFAGFYCPASTTQLNAVISGTNGANGTASINIANAMNQFNANPNADAFNNVGAVMNMAGSFDFGLPFFYGKSVFTAIEGMSTPVGTGPYVAF